MRGPGRPRGGVVAVIGASGGVGASTVAALLAARSAAPTTLVDLAPASGGLDVTLGIETAAGPRWPDLVVAGPGGVDLGSLPRWRGVRVLSADRSGVGPDGATLAAAWEPLLAAGGRVVVDLSGAVLAGSAVVLPTATEVVLLVGQDVRGVAGAIATRGLLGPGPLRVVLREHRRARVAPAEVEAALAAPICARIPHARALADATDAGLGPLAPDRSRVGRTVAGLDRALGTW